MTPEEKRQQRREIKLRAEGAREMKRRIVAYLQELQAANAEVKIRGVIERVQIMEIPK